MMPWKNALTVSPSVCNVHQAVHDSRGYVLSIDRVRPHLDTYTIGTIQLETYCTNPPDMRPSRAAWHTNTGTWFSRGVGGRLYQGGYMNGFFIMTRPNCSACSSWQPEPRGPLRQGRHTWRQADTLPRCLSRTCCRRPTLRADGPSSERSSVTLRYGHSG